MLRNSNHLIGPWKLHEPQSMPMDAYKKCNSWQELQDVAPGSIGGWTTVEEREWLFWAIRALSPGQRFVEIGVFGGTTLAMTAMITEGVDIVGIDSFENEPARRARDRCAHPVQGKSAGEPDADSRARDR